LLEQMVSWQRRALNSLCGRVDLLQADIDRQAGAQTELESRLLDLEQYVYQLAPSTWMQWQTTCAACAYIWRSSMEIGPVVYCPRCGIAQSTAPQGSAALAEAQWRMDVGASGGHPLGSCFRYSVGRTHGSPLQRVDGSIAGTG
jgi:hypothetical protein